MRLAPFALAACVGFALACGGVSTGSDPGDRPNPDLGDPAEIARLRREYTVAESMLKDRIRKNPQDHHAHRLLGDVNLSRGQEYTKRWKENLTRAFSSYARAVELQPDNCLYWARVAGTASMASVNEQTRIGREAIEALPLDAGWTHCAGAALIELEVARHPTEAELELAGRTEKDPWRQLALAAPWLADAWARAPLDQVAWVEGPGPAPLTPGRPFVVLEPPMQARGQGHEFHRPVPSIERFVTSRVSENRVVFTDRRFPERVPAEALVEAAACKHTAWKAAGPDGVPVGTCTTGEFLRHASALYDPNILRHAGPAHFHHPSIKPARIPGEQVIEGSVACTGGPVGRKLEYMPTCRVRYDKPNYLTRWLPADKVAGARDDAHADQLTTAQGMQAIWGPELTQHAVRGDVGVGMPYALFRYSRANLRGCQGRALLATHRINGGQLEFRCIFNDDGVNRAFVFLDLQLVYMGEANEAPGVVAADDE